VFIRFGAASCCFLGWHVSRAK